MGIPDRLIMSVLKCTRNFEPEYFLLAYTDLLILQLVYQAKFRAMVGYQIVFWRIFLKKTKEKKGSEALNEHSINKRT